MKCPECGNSVEPEAQFCSKCFARIEPPGFWQKLLRLFQGSDKPRKPIIKIKRSVSIRTTDKDGQQHEYHSLDDAPAELRQELEKLESQALKEALGSSSSEGHTNKILSRKETSLYKVKDASGNERVYHSLEELPPEIRAAFERAQKKSKE
jgi:hypothetical protein